MSVHLTCGIAGMSYMMDFEEPSNVSSADAIMEYPGGFRLVCDPKSLLYLFGELATVRRVLQNTACSCSALYEGLWKFSSTVSS